MAPLDLGEGQNSESGETVKDVAVLDFDVPYIRKGLRFTKNTAISRFLKKYKSTLLVDPHKCVACGICRDNCPAEAIAIPRNLPVFDYEKCIRCYCCQELCPEQAIDIRESLLIRLLSVRKRKRKG
ncbi:MAG: 4Fe-4S binding protein [Clostridia bacterium]